MGEPLALSCPHCSTAFRAWPGERLVCHQCAIPLLVAPGDEAVEIRPQTHLSAREAVPHFARLFERDGEPLPGPPDVTTALFFVPFYQLSGTMAGVTAAGRTVHRWAQAFVPAIDDRDDLGLIEVDAARLSKGSDCVRSHGLWADQAEHDGSVLRPEGDREEIEAILAEEVRIPADGEEAVLLDRSFAILYYPIWRLRYTVRGILYQATVDGLTGKVLAARVPAKQRRRILNAVAAAACFGYILGTMLRHPALGLPELLGAISRAEPATLLPTVGVALVGLGFYVLLLNATWNALRYRNELWYHSGLKTRLLINRPAETLLDQATEGIKHAFERLFGPRRFDR